MDYTNAIRELFSVFFDFETILVYQSNYEKVNNAINVISLAYKPNEAWKSIDLPSLLDFNDIYNQYVYLHRFAKLHTGLACNVLQKVFRNSYVFNDIISRKKLNLCSLGGGPGTDIFALLFVLKEVFAKTECKITVVDNAKNWEVVFQRLISKMISTFCDYSRPLPSWCENCEYLNADLLTLPHGVSPKVWNAVSNADIITMIKFISAVACNKTPQMVKAIFDAMKPGAMLLFIDNAGGGFHDMMERCSQECGLTSIVGPVKHYLYSEPRLVTLLHGNWSLDKVRVTIQVWKKMSISDHIDVHLAACILRGAVSNNNFLSG